MAQKTLTFEEALMFFLDPQHEVTRVGNKRVAYKAYVRDTNNEYAVVSDGNMISYKNRTNGKRGDFLHPYTDDKGYRRVNLPPYRQNAYLHSLVAEHHIGPRPMGALVCHWDGDKANNDVSNLVYSDHKGNALDRKFHENPDNVVKVCEVSYAFKNTSTGEITLPFGRACDLQLLVQCVTHGIFGFDTFTTDADWKDLISEDGKYVEPDEEDGQ